VIDGLDLFTVLSTMPYLHSTTRLLPLHIHGKGG
jgi:hypothetical protein